MAGSLSHGPEFLNVVRAAIVDTLLLGDPKVEAVAARLGHSPQALQTSLSEHGLTYKRFVNEVRCELACLWLASSRLTLLEITRLLAYSEPSSFCRAFRRWTGMTPGEYRDQNALGSSKPAAAGRAPFLGGS